MRKLIDILKESYTGIWDTVDILKPEECLGVYESFVSNYVKKEMQNKFKKDFCSKKKINERFFKKYCLVDRSKCTGHTFLKQHTNSIKVEIVYKEVNNEIDGFELTGCFKEIDDIFIGDTDSLAKISVLKNILYFFYSSHTNDIFEINK